jgi:putative protease
MKILAPGRNAAAVRTLLQQGADSCYIGLKHHNARLQSTLDDLNVTIDELTELAADALRWGRELFVVLNGSPTDRTMERSMADLRATAALPVAGLIVADFGLLDLLRSINRDAPVKFSIQGGACNVPEILAIDRWFTLTGITLPRFIRLDELAEMRRALPSRIEIEVLGHGLICPNVEGQCFLGKYLVNSSANLGGAGQPEALAGDRAPLAVLFDLIMDNPQAVLEQGIMNVHPCQGLFNGRDRKGSDRQLRLHDHLKIASLELVDQLMAAGVGRLKIEGRQHPVERMLSIVRAYRRAIDAAEACRQKGVGFKASPSDLSELSRFEYYQNNLTENHLVHNPVACHEIKPQAPVETASVQ